MAVTGQQAFDKAIKLMDEISETGDIIYSKIQDYTAKAPGIIEILQFELADSGSTFVPYTDLSQNLIISDMKALVILPYGLASELMISSDDDQTIASYFNGRYEELKRKFPAAAYMGRVNNVYGVD